MSSDRHDPLEDIEQPTLAERLWPYRPYGDTELALALLSFHRKFGVGMHATDGGDVFRFNARAQPANTGADYVCPTCEEPVRGVSRLNGGVLRCPLCGEQPGMLALGRGLDGETDE